MGVDAVKTHGVQLDREAVGQVGISTLLNDSTLVVGLECCQDVVGVVYEVEDVHPVLSGPRAVETGEGLNGHHTVQALVDVHRAQQRLVEPHLILVGHDHDLVGGAVQHLIQGFALGADVDAGLGVLTHAE